MAELAFDVKLARRDFAAEMRGAIPLEGVTALMGPSGGGKTTLLRMLAGLEPRARGEIRFAEAVWQRRGRRRRPPEARRIGFVFQDERLFDHLSVLDNVSYGARRRGVPASAVHGIAEGLGLQHLLHRAPATLSGGEARRVALARALAADPEILFLDEPLAGLDERSKAQVLPYVARAVTGSGLPVLYATHAAEEVAQFADRVLRIESGRIAGWDRPPARLAVTVTGAQAGHVTVELAGASFRLDGEGRPGDARRIALPDRGLLVSRDRPGPSGALAVLTAEVAQVTPRPSGPDLVLEVDGQRFAWRLDPASALAAAPPRPGERLWLSILSARLR